MIRLDVQEYCQQCMDFDAEVEKPQRAYGLGPGGQEVEFVLSDTVVRCTRRKRCEAIRRYLERQEKTEAVHVEEH